CKGFVCKADGAGVLSPKNWGRSSVAKSRTQQQRQQPQSRKARSTSWPQAISNIVIASINKGQLPVLGLIAIFLVLVWRLPPEELAKLAREMLEALEKRELIGYAASLIFGFGWFFHARWMRKEFSNEYERIGREKSHAQSKAAGKNFPSSEK